MARFGPRAGQTCRKSRFSAAARGAGPDAEAIAVRSDNVSSPIDLLVYNARETHTELYRRSCDSHLLALVVSNEPHSFSEKLKRASMQGYFASSIDKAKKEIASRLGDETLGLDDMAAAAGLSRFHFLRSFKRRVGVSPAKYVQGLRLELAKAELARGATVNEAARRSGYSCLSTFNKAFRRHTRRAPGAFRASATSV